jgi:hypothetical protein
MTLLFSRVNDRFFFIGFFIGFFICTLNHTSIHLSPNNAVSLLSKLKLSKKRKHF